MEIKREVRESPGYILQVLGSCLSIMYLLFGLGSVMVFILINTGLIRGVPHLVSLHQTYSALIGSLTASFTGFLTNILLVLSGINLNLKLIVPWLVFHLIFLLVLILGGLILLLHLLITLHLYIRSLLCIIPILTGLLLIFVWLKVYLQLFTIRRLKRHRKFLLLRNFYNIQHSAPSYIPNQEDLYSRKLHQQGVRPRLHHDPHFYHTNKKDFEQSHSRLVSVGNLSNNFYKSNKPHNYFFGDAMGFLKRLNRSMETIEASINFEEEKEEEDHHYENVKGSEKAEVEDIYIISTLGTSPENVYQT